VYPVLKIEGRDIHRPYFVRGSGQCFVRIGSSTTPASRTTVLNLFSNTIAKRTEVQRLRTAAGFLKEALTYTSENIHDIESMDHKEIIPEVDLSNAKILEVDLSYIRNVSLSSEWFLVQNDLLGGHISIDSFRGGFYSFIHDLERLNLSIRTHNNQITFGESKDSVLSLWEPGHAKYKESISFLDKIVSKCDEYLTITL